MKRRGPGAGKRAGPSRGGERRDGRRPFPHSGRPAQKSRNELGRSDARGSSLRDRPGRWVVGIHSCQEVFKVRPRSVATLLLKPGWETSEELREIYDSAVKSRVSVEPPALKSLDALATGHQGVAVLVNETPEFDWASIAEPGKQIVLALDGVEDPQNLGSIIRTAWLSGVRLILIPEDRATGLTPTVCKVASGGAEHVPVLGCANLAHELQTLKEKGFWVYGLAEAGEQMPWQFRLPEKIVWVIGSEATGMRVPVERSCDELVRLPQISGGSSFNASIAAAMALYETCRQFGNPG